MESNFYNALFAGQYGFGGFINYRTSAFHFGIGNYQWLVAGIGKFILKIKCIALPHKAEVLGCFLERDNRLCA